jgi:hypothetical protein
MKVELPGGLLCKQTLEKQARFKIFDGHIEMACQSAIVAGQGNPEDVTALLNYVLAFIGPHAVREDMIRALGSGDRKYLLVCLCIILKGNLFWFQNTCQSCGEIFDIQMDLEALPIKPAGELFPFAKITIQGNKISLRVPDGKDLELICNMPQEEAVNSLLIRCLEGFQDSASKGSIGRAQKVNIDDLSDSDRGRIVQAIEDQAPDVGTRIQTQCPSCERDAIVTLDLWEMLRQCVDHGSIFADVNILASHYHWSEREILSLARDKRQIYLKLIDVQQGMSS